MSKIDKNSLGYLGVDYQYRLMGQILMDGVFGNLIIDIIDPNYFEDPNLRVIAASIKEAKKEYDIIPNIESLKIRLIENVNNDMQRRFIITQLEKIESVDLDDTLKTQDIAIRFCKQQELKKSIKEIQKIIDKGDLNDYPKCESILRKALEYGHENDEGIDLFDNISEVLAEDFRHPIRTGIKGLDEIMDGGLSKTELAVIIAPTGSGKTTLLTKIANSAVNDGHNVLQIFFEDTPKIIQRKHLSCWSGYDLNSLSYHKDELMELCKEKMDLSKGKKGKLILKKFSSFGITIPIIRKYINKLIAKGFRPDIVLLDYIDCVTASKTHTDNNVGEGVTMREFETMLTELNVAGWTAVQSNRNGLSADVVETNQIGGSIKKAQIGHFILSIAKPLDQRKEGTATIAILKSRFGKDGMIFKDIMFDNKRMKIEFETPPKTQKEYKKVIENEQLNRLNEVLDDKARRDANKLQETK